MKFRNAILLVIIAETLIAMLAILSYGFTISALQAVTRFSGRLSLIIFSLIFILSAYDRKKLHSIISGKPFLVFAVAHGIHLIELISFISLSGSRLIPIRLAGGFLAYVFIFSMPFIQQAFEKGKISSKRFGLAGNIYAYYVWLIFFMSYLPRVQGKLPNVGGTFEEFIVLLIWVCLLLFVRFAISLNVIKSSTIKTS